MILGLLIVVKMPAGIWFCIWLIWELMWKHPNHHDEDAQHVLDLCTQKALSKADDILKIAQKTQISMWRERNGY